MKIMSFSKFEEYYINFISFANSGLFSKLFVEIYFIPFAFALLNAEFIIVSDRDEL